MNDSQLVFCNVDEQGKILELICGANIIPDKPYRYFFMIEHNAEIPMGASLEWLEQKQNEYIANKQ